MKVTATCKQCGKKIDLTDEAFAVIHLGLQIHGQTASYPEYHLHWPLCATELANKPAKMLDILGSLF